tara:strand:- start:1078 stop:1809 length:732 start_codon:yes stop_codon:yes gene_type:complete
MSLTLKKNKEIQGKQELLLVSLNKFYKDNKNKECIKNILTGEGKISLRIIDWFVTNFSKKHNIEYLIKTKNISPKRNQTLKKNTNTKLSKKDFSKYNSANKQINIFLSYKSQLRAYSKKQFDPFCRRNRIDFYFDETDYITTTVGQLNFFRWAIQNNVIEYILSNYKVIEKDMNDNTKKQRLNSKLLKEKKPKDEEEIVKSDLVIKNNITNLQNKERKKRQPLSIAATNNMNMNKVAVLLNFD